MFGLFLTFLKPFNTAAVILFLVQGQKKPAALAILFLMICDIFDGIAFRQSRFAANKKLLWFRRVVDVVGDRLAIEVVLVWMIWHNGFPLGLYAIEGVREIFLGWLVIYGYRKHRPLREPNFLSRVSAFFVGLMAMAWLTAPAVSYWLVVGVVGFGIPGALRYYRTIVSGT